MRYPTLTATGAVDLAWAHASGHEATAEVHWQGVGDDVDLDAFETMAHDLCADLSEDAKDWEREAREGEYAVRLYEALAGIPVAVLDDPAFWRYLTMVHLWDFVVWREHEAFARRPDTPSETWTFRQYVTAQRASEAVATRMYLRAAAVMPDAPDLASAIREGADFWRSHLIRVRSGAVPPVARSYVAMQRDDRMKTSELRQLAKVVNRTWANIVPQAYDDGTALGLLEQLRATVSPPSTS